MAAEALEGAAHENRHWHRDGTMTRIQGKILSIFAEELMRG
jgi:hypothetical protein